MCRTKSDGKPTFFSVIEKSSLLFVYDFLVYPKTNICINGAEVNSESLKFSEILNVFHFVEFFVDFRKVWFGALRSVFFNTRANYTGTYCLKPIPNGYEHPCLKQDSNPQTTVPNGSASAIARQALERLCDLNIRCSVHGCAT